MKNFYYFEHPADIGIVGVGTTVEQAFEAAAAAMFNIETDIEKVKPKKSVNINCQAETIEELLIEWLNRLLAEASIRDMFFSSFEVKKIKELCGKKKLEGVAIGDKMKSYRKKTEVKAATYAELFVGKEKNLWVAKCVVDV